MTTTPAAQTPDTVFARLREAVSPSRLSGLLRQLPRAAMSLFDLLNGTRRSSAVQRPLSATDYLLVQRPMAQ